MQKPRLADVIAFAVTDDIISQRLPPGMAIDEAKLGQRFGASRTPVREALRELAASGLVQLRPHRAPIVAAVDHDRIAEMFDVMAELEALCAARSSTAMTPKQRAMLESQHQAMGEVTRSGDTIGYRAANIEFHALIYDGAHNAYLRELALATRIRLGPYRGAQLEAPARLAHSYAEHEAIVTAIVRGQAERAAALMRQHLALTREALSRLRQEALPAN